MSAYQEIVYPDATEALTLVNGLNVCRTKQAIHTKLLAILKHSVFKEYRQKGHMRKWTLLIPCV